MRTRQNLVTERHIPAAGVPALTGLRAVAAYLVFGHHYNGATPGSVAHRLLAQGYVGVSIFFVLSGFLIYHRYAERYVSDAGWSWRTYLQNRFAKIFPVYALVLLLTVVVNHALGHGMSWPVFGLNVTLLKGLFDDYKFSGIPQSWSLTVEACFYGLAPLLFRPLQRWGALRVTAGLTGIGLLLWATVGQFRAPGLFGSLPFLWFYTFFGRAFEFVAGMWLAQHWPVNQLLRIRWTTVGGLALILFCVGWQACLTGWATNASVKLWSEVVTYNYVLPVGIAGVLSGLRTERSLLRKILVHPTAQALGRSSYAFYLIHLGVLAKVLEKTVAGSNRWLLFGLLVVLAHGLYQFVEKPLQARLRSERPRLHSAPVEGQ